MERLSIGDLARATGLTVRALRHYQDLGLLVPAGVDPATATGPTAPSSSRTTGLSWTPGSAPPLSSSRSWTG